MLQWLKRKAKRVVTTPVMPIAIFKPRQQPVEREFVPWINWGYCPDCGANDQWLEGPAGGMCINYTCDACGSKFNVGMPPLKLIQRIGYDGREKKTSGTP